MSERCSSLPANSDLGNAHSNGAGSFGGSGGESSIISLFADDITSSSGVISGVGSTQVVTTKGAL